MSTTILLIALIIYCIFGDLLPRKNYDINFSNAVNAFLSFFISTYIIYYLFNALDFGFTLTYAQVIFIYFVAGKADLFNIVKRSKDIDDFKKN